MSVGGLRASDADRDSVVHLLHIAYAEGRISYDEHAERVAASLKAKTFDDLLPLTADLVPVSAAPVNRPDRSPVSAECATDEPDRITAALSEVKRIGPWRVRRRSFTHIVLGSVKLDLTEATFDALVVEINLTQFMGSLFVRVPLGMTVRDETARVLGETSIKGIGAPDAALPTIVITGVNVLGELKVRGPKQPSMWRRVLA